ncbi:MAG: hypothetical protein IJT88_02440 [Kiritimatiellae bacterium]|nr:hypothetical protein [Kiritimatiellia bacterium]
MSDAKVKIEVALDGADAANAKLGELVKTLGSAGTAAQDSSSALQAHAAAAGKDTKSTGDNAKAVKDNTQATLENAKAVRDAAKAAQTATTSAKEYERFTQSAGKAIGGLQLANQAFSRLMMGDVVGAFKMASMAAKEFFAAVVANPVLLVIAGIAAAVAGLAAHFKRSAEAAREARQQWEETRQGIADANQSYEELKSDRGGPDYGSMSDNKLQHDLHFTKKRREQSENAANIQAMLQAKGDSRYSENDFKSADESRRKYLEEERAIQAEIARRESQTQEARKRDQEEREKKSQELKAQRERFEETKHYDTIEAEAEQKKKGSGKLAGLEARRDDLKEQLASSGELMFENERQDAVEKLYDLEKQITAEKARQAELDKQQAALEEKRKELQADWARAKKLDKMEAGDRVKYIEGEMAELRKGPRNAETEAKMRRLIDERDQAKAQADAQQKTQADWARGRKLGQMGAAERVKALEAEKAELKKGPRTAETEAKMRRVIDELDRAKAEVRSEAERAAQKVAKEEPESVPETRQKEYVGGFRQFRQFGDREERAARRAARARKQSAEDMQGAQIRSRSGLTPTYRGLSTTYKKGLSPTYKSMTPWYAKKGPRGLQQDKTPDKSPEVKATEDGNKILEEIREALK